MGGIGRGGDGNDTLLTLGSNAPVTFRGGAGDDDLNGGQGDDRLVGGSGSDRFQGNGGADRLVSKADGATDRFVFLSNAPFDAADRIIGFETGIDLLEIFFTGFGTELVLDGGGPTGTDPALLYDAVSGRLVFDFNGTDGGGRSLIAKFDPGTQLGAGDFLLFGGGGEG
jgi:Ca2+-binding RTX toxin-like protein